MTAEQRELIQRSFAQVLPIADSVAKLFYDRLFEIEPSLRPLFRGDLYEQGKALMGMLKLVVVA